MTLETAKLTQAATFIVPSSEFKNEAKITHWELDAIKTGEVLLQVNRVYFLSHDIFASLPDGIKNEKHKILG